MPLIQITSFHASWCPRQKPLAYRTRRVPSFPHADLLVRKNTDEKRSQSAGRKKVCDHRTLATVPTVPCMWAANPCSYRDFSLICIGRFFRFLFRNQLLGRHAEDTKGNFLIEFPVFFPDIREFGVETGSPVTASSATKSTVSGQNGVSARYGLKTRATLRVFALMMSRKKSHGDGNGAEFRCLSAHRLYLRFWEYLLAMPCLSPFRITIAPSSRR